MGESSRETLDPLLEEALDQLRQPIDLGDRIDQQVLAELRRSRLGRRYLRLAIAATLAFAAGLAAFLLAPTSPRAEQRQLVRFAIQASSASSVAVVGDFNQWDPAATPLTRTPDGYWSVTIPLSPGRYRFSFLVDGGTWLADPTRQPMPDPDFDTPTSLVAVEGRAL